MHDRASPPGGDGTVPNGQRFHQSGPWLIISGRDRRSEAAAAYIADLCVARGVDCERIAADDTLPCRIDFFFGLVVVLPTDITGEGARMIDRIGDHISAYRTRRPCGLGDLRQGERWFAVGVVQVFDLVGGAAADALGPARRAACQLRRLAAGEMPNPFAVYDSIDGGGVPVPPADVHVENVDTLWQLVRSWGVEPSQVAPVLKFIDVVRNHWEDSRYPVLHRPVPGIDKNRFDFVLDKRPDYRPGADVRPWRKWMEDGQRTVNFALDALTEAFPNVGRPAERAKKRDLQRDFHDFYQALSTLDDLSKETGR